MYCIVHADALCVIGHAPKRGLWHELMTPRVLHFRVFFLRGNVCMYIKEIYIYVAGPSYMLYWCICSTQEGRGVCTSVYICVHECGMLMFVFQAISPLHHHSLFLPLHPSPPSTSYLYPDASLTVSNIYQATSTVDYESLNDCLDVPDSVYFQINANPTEEKKREAIITYFLNTIPLASWATLAGKLYYWEEHVSLEAVRKYLHHTTG